MSCSPAIFELINSLINNSLIKELIHILISPHRSQERISSFADRLSCPPAIFRSKSPSDLIRVSF